MDDRATHGDRGPRCVVTGATGGVGQAVARRLAERGSEDLWLLGRRAGDLDRLCGDLKRPRVCALAGDLTDDGFVKQVGARVAESTDGLDLLVHAAGRFSSSGLRAFSERDFDDLFSVNVRSRFALTRELLPLLERRSGLVVFVNSSVALRSPVIPGLYAASMHAMRTAADTLRQEVNASGVRVLSLYLGRTATRMQERIHEEDGRPYRPDRLIQPSTVANLIVDLLQLPGDAEITDLSIRPRLPRESG